MTWVKIWKKFLFLIISLIFSAIVFYGTYLFMDFYLVVEDPLEKSSIVYVPAGKWTQRVPAAVQLLKDQWADHIYIGQGKISDSQRKLFEKYGIEIYRTKNDIIKFLKNEGLTAQVIFLKETSSTLEEMKALLEEHRNRNFSKIIIVTNPPYTRRTRMLFNRIFEGSNVTPILYPSQSKKDFKGLFAEERDYKVTIFTETCKYFYYLFD